MRFGIVRIKGDRLLEFCRSLFELALLAQHGGQVVVRLGQVGPQDQRLHKFGGRRVELALFSQYVAQIVVRFGQIRLESDRLPKPCRRLIQLALLPQNVAQVVERQEQGRLDRYGRFVVGHCFVGPPQLHKRIAQLVVRFSVVGPQRQNLSIGRRRFLQPPGTLLALR